MTRPFALLSAAVILAPVAFLVALRLSSGSELSGINVDTTPIVAPSTARTIDDRTGVDLQLAWGDRASLLAPAWSGTVTAVYGSPGDVVTSGTAVLSVGGIDRVAFATDRPFHRSLSSGDTGPDVEQLHQLLVALGHMDALPAAPSAFNAATTAAVRRFELSLGMPESTGRFDPALVIWLPEEPFLLGELSVTVAAPAPSPGQPFATSRAELLSASFSAQNASRPLSLDPGVEYVLTVDGETFAVDPSAATVQSGDLGRLAEVALSRPPAGQGPFGAPASSGPPETLSGSVQRVTPLQVLAIPATSVVTNAQGGLCVWVVSEDDEYQPIAVTVHSSLSGVTNVTGGLSAEAEVLANPADALSEPACP